MISTLATLKKKNPKKTEESEEDYKDRIIEDAYWKLREKKKRTKKEEEEYKDVQEKFVAYYVVKRHGMSSTTTDADLKLTALRLHKELTKEHGNSTPVKALLIDRLVAAWSMAASYERLFQIGKYKVDMSGDDPFLSYSHSKESVRLMQETRKGIETANDQIIRLTQALRNLSYPPIHVKAQNAVVAQNMQFNQKSTSPEKDAETTSRAV